MLAMSFVAHFLLGAIWSVNNLFIVQNTANPAPIEFTVVKLSSLPLNGGSAPAFKPLAKVISFTSDSNSPYGHLSRKVIDEVPSPLPPAEPPRAGDKLIEKIAPNVMMDDLLMGPFQSEIDPKKAWVNVAESLNYDLLRGISIDVSQGQYRMPGEVELRVRAKGDLTIEYPFIAAALGKEAVIYALLLIDEQGQKIRVQIARGDPDFDNAVLQSLEKVEFRPAMLKQVPVRSLLLLEFEFRRNPPEIGSL